MARLGGGVEHVRKIWKTLAFLGRYGHQCVDVCLDMTLADLFALAGEVGSLIRDEGEAMRTAHD
jgi:hypothetical protein